MQAFYFSTWSHYFKLFGTHANLFARSEYTYAVDTHTFICLDLHIRADAAQLLSNLISTSALKSDTLSLFLPRLLLHNPVNHWWERVDSTLCLNEEKQNNNNMNNKQKRTKQVTWDKNHYRLKRLAFSLVWVYHCKLALCKTFLIIKRMTESFLDLKL